MISQLENPRIACVGEAMIELILDTDGGHADVGYAGDTLNTAVYLHRMLTKPHQVDFVTCLGEDPFSDRLCDFVESQGVSTGSIDRLPDRMPGLYAITTDDNGERSFHYWHWNQACIRILFCILGKLFSFCDFLTRRQSALSATMSSPKIVVYRQVN